MNKILFTLMLLASSILVNAQIGITVGGNSAKYRYTDADRKFLIGFNAGLFYKHDFNEKTFIKPELIFTTKGATLYTPIFIGSTNPVMKYQNRLNFIQLGVPFLVGFEVTDELDFDFGPSVFASYLIGAKYTAKNFDGTSSTGSYKIGGNATDDFKSLDYGVGLTAGFTLSKTLGFHFKYELGLANLNPKPNDKSLKTGNISFNISYAFGERD